MAVAKAFIIISLPFVLAEGATGITSLFTGESRIPPTVFVWVAVDTAILTAGLVVAPARPVRSGHPDEHAQKKGKAQLQDLRRVGSAAQYKSPNVKGGLNARLR